MAVTCSSLVLVFSGLLLVTARASDGVPRFGIWVTLIALTNGFVTLLTPTCYALGLEPMGALAGTASAVMGFSSTAGGSLLAAIVDAAIDGTVTPMAVGYLVYGSVSLTALLLARRRAPVVITA